MTTGVFPTKPLGEISLTRAENIFSLGDAQPEVNTCDSFSNYLVSMDNFGNP